jgi:hypothetical protein
MTSLPVLLRFRGRDGAGGGGSAGGSDGAGGTAGAGAGGKAAAWARHPRVRAGAALVLALILVGAVLALARRPPHGSLGRPYVRWRVWWASLTGAGARGTAYALDTPPQADGGVRIDAPPPPTPPGASAAAPPPAVPAGGTGLLGAPLFAQRRAGSRHGAGAACEAAYGNTWLRAILDARETTCAPRGGGGGGGAPPRSRVTAHEAGDGSRVYTLVNVSLDFSRVARSQNMRTFLPGFIRGACDAVEAPLFAGGGHDEPALSGDTWEALASDDALVCDTWVHTPTIVVQHDDIGNTYHNLADLWRVWVAAVVLNEPSCDAADGSVSVPAPAGGGGAGAGAGVRGAAGRGASSCPPGSHWVPGVPPAALHVLNLDARIMCASLAADGTPGPRDVEDCVSGPYFPQYGAWFGGGVLRPADLGGGRVCFSSLTWAASLPHNQVWAAFDEESACDAAPSPIFRQFLDFTVANWGLAARVPATVRPPPGSAGAANASVAPAAGSSGGGGSDAPARPYLRVGYVVRKAKPFGGGKPITSRVIANEEEFVAAVAAAAAGAGADVDVVPLEFTGMPYAAQFEAVRSCHVLIGMHGAGLVHAVHMADGDACGGRTALVEVLNLPSHSTYGVQHLARMAGRDYYRWVNEDPAAEVEGRGTVVDAAAVGRLVAGAAARNLATRRAGCRLGVERSGER